MSKKTQVISILLIGVLMIGAALFANQLGLHSGAHWGLGRRLLFITGAIFLLSGLFYGLFQQIYELLESLSRSDNLQLLLKRIKPAFVPLRSYLVRPVQNFTGWLSQSKLFRWLGSADPRTAFWAAIPIIGCVLTAYLWIVSVGRWNNWPATTTYYDQLADSFLMGHTYLPETPDPRLAAIANPYDFAQRQMLSIPWDVSYYKNHYYLYWGPTPALLLAPIKAVIHNPIRDDFLVFVFTSGSFLLTIYIIFLIWRNYFQKLPWWVTSISILTAGLINPLPWLLSRPAIYEAAISSSQFFLLAGLAAVMTVLFRETGFHRYRAALILTFGSFCWVLAIGSRATLAAPILLLSALTVWQIYRSFPRFWLFGSALFFPLLAGAILLGWYNLVRFDSIIEFGHRYQLTGLDQNTNYAAIISFANLPANLYNYLANPFRRLPVFPFIKPQTGGHYLFFYIRAPKLYYTEQVVGIIPSAPFVLLAVVPTWLWIKKLFVQPQKLISVISPDPRSINAPPGHTWLAIALSGGSIAALIPLLVFLVCSMRYSADFVPLLTLAAIFGYWQGIHALDVKPFWRFAWEVIGIGLALVSAGMGMLLGITGYAARFEIINPVLFDQLTRFFAR